MSILFVYLFIPRHDLVLIEKRKTKIYLQTDHRHIYSCFSAKS